MADFPTLGLNFDLTEIVLASRKLQEAKSAYLELGGASEEAAKEAEAAAGRVVNAAKKVAKAASDAKAQVRGRGGRPPKSAEELQMEAITKAIGEKSRFWKQRSAEQMTAERAAAAEAAALTARQDRIAADSLAFRMRMTKQRAAEATAADNRVAEASRAAEEKIRREGQQTFEFRMRMARQRASEEARLIAQVAAAEKAARDRAAADAKIDADLERTLIERNASFRTEAVKRAFAEEEAARNRRMADLKADADLEHRLAERNMDFRAQRIIQQSAGGGGNRGGGLGGLFGGGGGDGGVSALGRLNQAVGQVRTSFLNARFAVAAFLGALTVAPLVNILDTMTALQARVSLYAKAQSDVPYTFEALYKTAQDARQPLEGIATLYTRLAPLAEQLGKSQMQLLNVTRTVAQAFAIGGASAAESASSSQQLAQALAANRLGGDELRSLAENAPVLLQMIAKSLNMNSAQFIKWAHDGKASASVVVNAIEGAAGKIDEMFKRFPVTIGQSITLVGNSFAHLVDRVNVATGASTRIATEIAKLAEFMGRQSTIDSFTAGINNLGKAMSLVGSVIKGVVDYLPAIGAGMLTIAAAAAAPAVMTSLATAITAVGIAFTGASGRALVFGQVLTASSRGAAGLVATLGGMAGIITGGVVIAVALLVAGLVRVKKAQEEANNAAANYGDAQQGAIAALQRASSFAETYSINASSLNKTLLEVATSNQAAASGSDTATAANKAAMEMANARAEAERSLTVSILRRAAADAGKNANDADRSINGFLGVRDQLQIGRRLASPEAVAKAEKQIKDVEAVVNKERALQQKLEKVANEYETAKLTVTVPSGSGKPLATTTDPTKGVDGAVNRIARLRAEVEGLVAQINALSSDPLSDFSARINAAGEEAAAQYTAGKAKGFADTARQLAQQKEEATIRLQLTQQLTQQTRAQKDEAAQVVAATAARERATAAMTAYWTSGSRTAEGYAQALRLQADAETTGAIRAEQLRLAQEYGVSSIDDISEAYRKATGATQADADALEEHVRATSAATGATIRLTAAERENKQAADAGLQRQAEIISLRAYAEAIRLGTDALADYNREARLRDALGQAGAAADPAKVRNDVAETINQEDAGVRAKRMQDFQDELRIAAMAAEQREIEAEAMARVADAVARGSKDSDLTSLAWQRTQVAAEKTAMAVADMQARAKDGIFEAWMDTGQIDFRPLQDELKHALRKAMYDAWLAKPIQIVVDAIIRSTEDGNARLRDQLEGMGDWVKKSKFGQALGDIFTKSAGKFGDVLKKVLGNGGANLSQFAGNTMAGMQAGTAVADALGIEGSTSHKGWQTAMDLGFSAIGTAIGGPIGGAIGAFLSRTLGKAILGKESNHGAIASFDASGAFTGSLGGSKRNEETSGLATSAAQAITQGIAALRDLGAGLTTTVSKLDIGTRDTTHIDFTGGQHLETAVGDAEAAVQASLLLIARSANFGDAALQRFVDRIENTVTTIDELVTKIQAFQEALDFRTSVTRSVLQYTDPREFALANLRDTQVDRRRQAASYNAEGFYSGEEYAKLLADLGQLEQLEIADLLNRLATGLDGAVASLEKLKAAQADLVKYLEGLLTSDLSPLSPEEQLGLSGSKFNDLLAKAAGGDLEAFNQLTAASDEYLSAAQQFYGGTEAYAAIFDRVYQQLSGLSTQEFEDPVVGAIQQQTQLLIDAINQVTEAIGNEGGGAGSGGGGGAADWAAYLQQNPDVASAMQREISNRKSDLYGMSLEEAAQWHYNQYGKNEGRALPTIPTTATGTPAPMAAATAQTALAALGLTTTGLTDSQVEKIVAALKENAGQVTSQIAASTEAQVGTVASGLNNLTGATVNATSTAIALAGGQVRTQAA